MNTERQYLACPQRPGSPRVALDICRACLKAKRCAAWQEFRCPSLFPGLEAQRPRPASRAARSPVAAKACQAAQASLAITG